MPRKKKSYSEDDATDIMDGIGEEKELKKSGAEGDLGADAEGDGNVSLEDLVEEELEEETE